MAKIRKLLFVDTNILLDFYRARTEASLALLRHLEQVAPDIIVTFHLEMEFKNESTRRHAGRAWRTEVSADDDATRIVLGRQGRQGDPEEPKGRGCPHQQAQSANHPCLAESGPAGSGLSGLPTGVPQDGQPGPDARGQATSLHSAQGDQAISTRMPTAKAYTSIGEAVNWEWMVHCRRSKSSRRRLPALAGITMSPCGR